MCSVLSCIIGMVVCVATVFDYSRGCVKKTLQQLTWVTNGCGNVQNDSCEDSSLLGEGSKPKDEEGNAQVWEMAAALFMFISLFLSTATDYSTTCVSVNCLTYCYFVIIGYLFLQV